MTKPLFAWNFGATPARFALCHNADMDREHLVRLRNYIQTEEGTLLMSYLSDYITKEACKKREAFEIKGMCELLQQIKSIPDIVEAQASRR